LLLLLLRLLQLLLLLLLHCADTAGALSLIAHPLSAASPRLL
jgi:hypothetical protein